MFEFYRFGRFIFALQKAQIFCLCFSCSFLPNALVQASFLLPRTPFFPPPGKHIYEMFKGLFYGPVIRMLDFSSLLVPTRKKKNVRLVHAAEFWFEPLLICMLTAKECFVFRKGGITKLQNDLFFECF